MDVNFPAQGQKRVSGQCDQDRVPFVRSLGCLIMLALALAAAACGPAMDPQGRDATPGEWRDFEGSWNAAGSRRSISLGTNRRGSIIDLRGSMLLAGPGRPGVGFRSEAIALVDSETGLLGRSVWTDERGDQVFSELKGEGTAARNHIAGTFLGGTGRYAGATGSYEFSWQFVIEAEDGSIQGRAVGLKGRVRLGQAGTGGSRP
ncbi:MAG: hypothetical protein JNM42_11515 [Propionivibrio sp.]|uniref:hypothetical protein n=1 Tax=Propionivibrio sp. TaxID=2212460 RepID=UPI001A50A849|nr:hypothetical protein [Propionivibrio sp.]MBL8415054.1 hypothetical protein [Propionivibrio sp.]